MSREFKRDMESLHKEKKLSDFEYNQLVCLNEIAGALRDIDKRLVTNINDQIHGIKSAIELLVPKKE